MPAGGGQTIFGDVPVVPGSYPDFSPNVLGVKSKAHLRPQIFKYGSTAAPWNVLQWYERRLPSRGWHIDGIRQSYPARGSVAVIATRRGEAVTVVVAQSGDRSVVSIVKFNSAK